MSDPAQLMAAIDMDCRALDAAGKELGHKTKQLAEAELAYGDAFEAELAVLVEEHQASGERLPGEDVRRALIHARIDRALYRAKHQLRREVEALEKWGRMKEKTLSGRQSELSFLKAEASGPTVTQQPAWTDREREPVA